MRFADRRTQMTAQICSTPLRIGLVALLSSATGLLLMTLIHGTASAHPGEQGSIRATLLDWANGVAHANPEQLEGLLSDQFVHESFFSAPQNRAEYLEAVAAGDAAMTDIDLRHAQYAINRDQARVSDVLGLVMQTTRIAAEARLVRGTSGWQIESIKQLPELPLAARRSYPEHERLETVEIEVIDAEKGLPIATRIRIVDEEGAYWAPEGHMREVPTGWREDVGHDVVVEGRAWAYVPGRSRARLPAGRYTLEITRGIEYTPQSTTFRVKSGSASNVMIELRRWSDARQAGWYSGDTHVHFLDPEAAQLEVQGEDLNVLNILASKWGPLITNVEHFRGAPSPSSQPERIVYVGEETRHGWLGHSILLGIQRLIYPLTWGGPSEGVPGGFDYPAMATQADAAHAQGGLVTAAHFPWPNGELAVDIALGKLDAVDVLTWGDAFSDQNAMPAPPAVSTWYRYLNSGFDLPATAGTDKMYNTQVSGSVRVYAKVEGEFHYRAWLESIRAGRTFVTTAPILTFGTAEHEVGDTIATSRGARIKFEAKSRSRIPVAKLEIVDRGRVIAVQENPEGLTELSLEATVTMDDSTWLAARAYSPEKLPYQGFPMAGLPRVPVMAHTSPIYVAVDARPRRSAEDTQVLLGWVQDAIEWAETRARFQSPEHKAEMLDLFEQAAAVYHARSGSDSQTPARSESH